MRHVRMLGLCLVAVFAVAAVAATSASALPEWGQCYAKAGGKYANSNCTEKAKKGAGKFEWRKGTRSAPNRNISKAKAASGSWRRIQDLLHANEGKTAALQRRRRRRSILWSTDRVECETEANHGEASGSKGVANISVVFRGCKLLGSIPCSNTEIEGEIR